MTPRSLIGALLLFALALIVNVVFCAGPTPLVRDGPNRITARRASIKYNGNEAVSLCMQNEGVKFLDAVRNDSTLFWEAAQGNNQRFHYHPVAVAYPIDAKQVSIVIKCASQNGNVQVTARSGGHSFAGFSSGGQDGALIVDLANMNQTITDGPNALAHLGPASLLGDVVKALWADGKRGMPHGTCPTVGTGGHALCGGFGPTSRLWGMAADNLIEAEVVLADGSIVHASQHENEELWWALRGSGSFFGIVTKFTFSTYDASKPMTFLNYRWTSSLKNVDDVVKLIEGAQAFATKGSMPAGLGWHLQAQEPHEGDPPEGILAIHMRGMYSGPKDVYHQTVIPPFWKELKKRGLPEKPDSIVEKEMTYLQMMGEWDDFGKPDHKLDTLAERTQRNNFIARTSLSMGQRGFSNKGLKTILDPLWERASAAKNGSIAKDKEDYFAYNVYFEMFGGTNARHRDADLVKKSSLVHRDALWLIQSSVATYLGAPLAHSAHQYLEMIDSALIKAFKEDKVDRKSYSCYADATLTDWKELYYGSALPRLVALKKKLDPTNLFRNTQSLIDTPIMSPEHTLLVQKDGLRTNVHPLS